MTDVIEKAAEAMWNGHVLQYPADPIIRGKWAEYEDNDNVWMPYDRFRNRAREAYAAIVGDKVLVDREPEWTEDQKILRSIRIPDAPANDGAD